MTTLNLIQRQLKSVKKLVEYNFKVTYWESKKNSADSLLRQLNYELSKTASTLTAAEIIWQSFCLRSKNYKSVQKELYTLTAMTLQSRHSVQQLQQDNVVISTANTEDSDVTETSAVYDLHIQKACHNKYDISTLNTEDSDTTETLAVHDSYAQQASHNENNESVMSNSENNDMIRTSAVHDLHAQETSCDEYDISMINTEDSSMTQTSAVHHLSAHRASFNENDKSVMLKISSMTETSAVHHLHA